jgi:hypothetical protein
MFLPGRSTRATRPLARGSPTPAKTIGIVRVSCWTAAVTGVEPATMMSGCKPNQLLRERSHPIDVTAGPPKVHPHVAAFSPTQVRERLSEHRVAKLPLGIVFETPYEHADAPQVALLRPRRKRPGCRGAPEPCNELPPYHSITSSASASRFGGMVRPSAFAVLRLMRNLYLFAP